LIKEYNKHPALFAALVLIAYVTFFILLNVELYTAALCVVFVTAIIGWVGAVVTIKGTIRRRFLLNRPE